MESIGSALKSLRRFGRTSAPYFLLEILLPGGTLFALLLFLFRSGKLEVPRFASRAIAGVSRALSELVNTRWLAPQPQCVSYADWPRIRSLEHSRSAVVCEAKRDRYPLEASLRYCTRHIVI